MEKATEICSECVSDVEETSVRKHKDSWKPFLRQLLICSGTWLSQCMFGICVGAPTVFIPQLKKEADSETAISDDMASWLTSVHSFCSFPWVFIISIITKCYGRKIPYMFTMGQTLVGFIVFYCSTSVSQLLVSLAMLSLLGASQLVISLSIASECISPRYRGALVGASSAMFYWGVFLANTIGAFFHWKYIGLLGVACAAYNLLTSFFWPESPYWLATQGRYKQCADTHRWIKGCDTESKKELDNLLKSQKEYMKIASNKAKLPRIERIKDVCKTITERSFYLPWLLAFVSALVGLFSGKLVCVVYAIDIIKKITQNESTAYTGMLILDAITIFSMHMGCIIIRFFKRRPLFLGSSAVSVLFLFTISLYLYLIKLNIIIENKYVSLGLLTLFSIAISAGPMVISTSVIAELLPIRSRNLAMCAMSVCVKIILGLALKISPSVFKAFGIHGTFLSFGICLFTCILFLYKYLPETQDKTLQEIADSINGKNKSEIENVDATEKLVSANHD